MMRVECALCFSKTGILDVGGFCPSVEDENDVECPLTISSLALLEDICGTLRDNVVDAPLKEAPDGMLVGSLNAEGDDTTVCVLIS